MLQRIFIFFLVFLPFVIWKGGFEGPKVVYFFAGGFALFLFWIVRILKYKRSFSFTKTDYFYLLWLLFLMISSLVGIHPIDSIIGGSYRHQGVLFFLSLWVIGKTIQLLSGENKKLLAKMLGTAILIEALIVIFQFVNGNVYFGKPLGTMGEPNAVAGFLAGGLSFLTFRSLYFLAGVLIAVLLTHSRIGLFSFVISISVLFKKFDKKIVALLALLIVIGATITGYQILGSKIKYLFAPTRSLWHLWQDDRVTIWRVSFDAVVQRPILGWGAESSETVLDNAYRAADMPLRGLIVERSHSLILDILIWSGAIGLIFFVGWLYLSFNNLKDSGRKLAFTSLIVYSMFEPLSVVHWILLIIIVNI